MGAGADAHQPFPALYSPLFEPRAKSGLCSPPREMGRDRSDGASWGRADTPGQHSWVILWPVAVWINWRKRVVRLTRELHWVRAALVRPPSRKSAAKATVGEACPQSAHPEAPK